MYILHIGDSNIQFTKESSMDAVYHLQQCSIDVYIGMIFYYLDNMKFKFHNLCYKNSNFYGQLHDQTYIICVKYFYVSNPNNILCIGKILK